MNFLSELKLRNMLQDMTPGLDQVLLQEKVKGYIGLDPTAPSLHIGHLATIILVEHLQRAGHRPVLLLGGATGMIGDPSFKNQERRLLDEEKVRYHQECITKQLGHFFDFSDKNGPILLNNYSWYKDMNILSFLREAGKKISLNYMMSKESVKRRIKDGISYNEFAYQLLQGYDYYYLNKYHDVKLQMGGTDQWGNITTGIELIRKKSSKQVYALTTPLLTKSDGSKFGKTEEGNVWLDGNMTSPYSFYQFLLNRSDDEAYILLKRMTLYEVKEIESWREEHEKSPEKRLFQRNLAKYLITKVHSGTVYREVTKASEVLFGSGPAEELLQFPSKLLCDIFEQLPKIEILPQELSLISTLPDLLTLGTKHQFLASKRLAREMIAAGSIRINKIKVKDPHILPKLTWLLGRYLLIQKGKKNFFVLKKK